MTRRVSRRKVRLDLWRAELEVILATAREGLPFAVSLPADFACSHTDIGIFEAKLKDISHTFGSLPTLSAGDPVVFLMFYKPGQGATGPRELVSAVPALFEGRKTPPPGNVFILTAQESFDLPNKSVSWRLSRNRVRTMRQQGWCLVAYRSDTQEPRKTSHFDYPFIHDSHFWFIPQSHSRFLHLNGKTPILFICRLWIFFQLIDTIVINTAVCC